MGCIVEGLNCHVQFITYGKQITNPCFMYGRNSEKYSLKQLFSIQSPLIPQVRIIVFDKSSVDIAHLIECAVETDLSVFSCSDPFVCNRCYKRLLRFEKAKTNLRSLQEEIKEDLKKGANRTKRLSRNSAEKDGEIENINVPIELSTALQVQQRSAAKSLKFKQFLTTSTSSNAENDRTVGESYDILGESTYNVAREN